MLVALQALPEAWHRALWYDRAAVAGGEWWRILTGNFVHLGWMHVALNVGALVIGTWVFYPARTPVAWAVAQVVASLATGVGLFFFSPGVAWCVGMSGALHGLLMIGAIDWIRQGDRVGWLLLAIWSGKLVFEHFEGALPLSTETVGSAVVTDAHLWGAVGGLVFAAGEALWRRRRTGHIAMGRN
ncbi:MAG: rhombosortase [Gammaproteobacteria bacterium]|nr:rhombosortase [Gammaproteobacteria bacterium]